MNSTATTAAPFRLRPQSWWTLASLTGALGVLALAKPQGQWFYPRCLLHSLTGLECPACGCLRATHALLHFDLATAWALNPLFVMLAPWLAYEMAIRFPEQRTWPTLFGRAGIGTALTVLLLGYTVWRNITPH